MSYMCPSCGNPTEDYADHASTDLEGHAVLPVKWITAWGKDPVCVHSHARRYERENDARGKWGAQTEYRFGIEGDRVCWQCNAVMPHSICELVR